MYSAFARLRQGLRHARRAFGGYEPLVEVSVFKDAILYNLGVFGGLRPGVAVAPVLKSNAYGHGLVPVARILKGAPAPFLCVDSLFEARALRAEGIAAPILVIGYTPFPNMRSRAPAGVSFAIMSLAELRRAAERIDRRTIVQLKIDTGMHRYGILPSEIDAAIGFVRSNPRLIVEGAYSHLADADVPGSRHAAAQVREWNAVALRLRSAFPAARFFHLAASAGSVLAESDANVTRLGIGLYGVNVSVEKLPLRPALEMTTRITSVRTVPSGESVGYNATFTASRDTRIATIPVGYFEGVDRRLSGKGFVTVGGTPCPIVGRVSMNITSIDVTAAPRAGLDDAVAVISRDPAAPNSFESMARTCGTIPYELMVHLPAHLRRVVR